MPPNTYGGCFSVHILFCIMCTKFFFFLSLSHYSQLVLMLLYRSYLLFVMKVYLTSLNLFWLHIPFVFLLFLHLLWLFHLNRKRTMSVCSVLYLPPDLCLLSKGWHFHCSWCRLPHGSTYSENHGAKWQQFLFTQALNSVHYLNIKEKNSHTKLDSMVLAALIWLMLVISCHLLGYLWH